MNLIVSNAENAKSSEETRTVAVKAIGVPHFSHPNSDLLILPLD
jgi:hypothetical protein